MEPPLTNAGQLVETSKRFARRLLTIGENRFELLMVEVQEERERLLRAILLALGVAAFLLNVVLDEDKRFLKVFAGETEQFDQWARASLHSFASPAMTTSASVPPWKVTSSSPSSTSSTSPENPSSSNSAS